MREQKSRRRRVLDKRMHPKKILAFVLAFVVFFGNVVNNTAVVYAAETVRELEKTADAIFVLDGEDLRESALQAITDGRKFDASTLLYHDQTKSGVLSKYKSLFDGDGISVYEFEANDIGGQIAEGAGFRTFIRVEGAKQEIIFLLTNASVDDLNMQIVISGFASEVITVESMAERVIDDEVAGNEIPTESTQGSREDQESAATDSSTENESGTEEESGAENESSTEEESGTENESGTEEESGAAHESDTENESGTAHESDTENESGTEEASASANTEEVKSQNEGELSLQEGEIIGMSLHNTPRVSASIKDFSQIAEANEVEDKVMIQNEEILSEDDLSSIAVSGSLGGRIYGLVQLDENDTVRAFVINIEELAGETENSDLSAEVTVVHIFCDTDGNILERREETLVKEIGEMLQVQDLSQADGEYQLISAVEQAKPVNLRLRMASVQNDLMEQPIPVEKSGSIVTLSYQLDSKAVYTVSFNSNYKADAKKFTYDGKDGVGTMVDAQNTSAVYQVPVKEAKISMISGFSCTNYEFLGWTMTAEDAPESRILAGTEYPVRQNITFYAQWGELVQSERVILSVLYEFDDHKKFEKHDIPATLKDGQLTFQLHKGENVYQGEGDRQIGKNDLLNLSGWKIMGAAEGQEMIYEQGAICTTTNYTKKEIPGTGIDFYSVKAEAVKSTDTENYPAQFYVLKRGKSGSETDTSSPENYYFVGMGTVKKGTENQNYYSDSSKNVEGCISKKPDTNAIANAMEIPLKENEAIRWYHVINGDNGYHVDGIIYEVNRYWNLNYYDGRSEAVTRVVPDAATVNLLELAPALDSRVSVTWYFKNNNQETVTADGSPYLVKGNLDIHAEVNAERPELEIMSDEEIGLRGYSNLYDGGAHGITATLSGAAEGATLFYSLTDPNSQGFNEATGWSRTAPLFVNAAENPYIVYVKAVKVEYSDWHGFAAVNIIPLPITITAASAQKQYDGTALSKAAAAVSTGSLLNGETLTGVTVIGSQSAVGSSDNVASNAVIQNAKQENVTGNYEVQYLTGTLTVTASEIIDREIPSNDRNNSGPNVITSGSSNGPGASATTTILPDEVPLAAVPADANANQYMMIDDGEIPLAALPKTGNQAAAATWMMMFSSVILAAYIALSKKRKDETK